MCVLGGGGTIAAGRSEEETLSISASVFIMCGTIFQYRVTQNQVRGVLTCTRTI